MGCVTTATIPYAFLTSGDAQWQNSGAFSLAAGVYLMNASIFTVAASSSTTTYQFIIYSVSTSQSNTGTSYLLRYDTTQRLTETTTVPLSSNSRYFSHILVIPASVPTLYASVTFVYTVGGSGNQPQINPSTFTFTRIG